MSLETLSKTRSLPVLSRSGVIAPLRSSLDNYWFSAVAARRPRRRAWYVAILSLLLPGVDNIVITAQHASSAVPNPANFGTFAPAGVLYVFRRRRKLARMALLASMVFGGALVSTGPPAVAQESRELKSPGAAGSQVVHSIDSPRFCLPSETCPAIMQPAPWIGVSDRPEAQTPEEEEGEERAGRGLSKNTSKPVLSPPAVSPESADLRSAAALHPDAAKNPPTTVGTSARIRTKFNSNSGPPPNPADNAMAVGQQNVITANNAGIVIFDKAGNPLTQAASLQSFFGNPADAPFDPRVLYDEYLHRFWVVAVSANDTNQTSTIYIALSRQEDATAGFTQFSMDGKPNGSVATNFWCDYPTVGLDPQAIYIGCNMFTFKTPQAGYSFQYSKLRIMTKSQFTGNTCCVWWDFFNNDLTDPGLVSNKSFTLRPAVMHAAANADGEYIVNAVGGGSAGSKLVVRKITSPANCCVRGSQTAPVIATANLTVGSFDTPPAARQPDGVTPLDTGGTRLQFAFWKSGKLSTGQTLAADGGAAVAYTEIDVSAFPTMNVVDDFAVHAAGKDAFYPAAEMNGLGMRALVFNSSGPGATDFVGAAILGIPADTTCTNCSMGPIVTFLGGEATSFNDGGIDPGKGNRWGDYSGAGPDTDGKSVWVFGSYTPRQNVWGTIGARIFTPIASLSPASLTFTQALGGTSPAQTVTLTNTGDVPLSISSIQASGLACGGDIMTNGFAQTNNCPGSLAAGASCTIPVTFTPTCQGAFSGSVAIADDAAGSPQIVTMAGTGQAAPNLVTLAKTTTPAQIQQRSQEIVSVTGAPFPNDNLVANRVVVTFSVNGGADRCVTAAQVQQVNGAAATWQIGFQVPSFLSGTVQVTVSGLTARGIPFSSASSSQLTIVPAN